jgi:hypothetical protein
MQRKGGKAILSGKLGAVTIKLRTGPPHMASESLWTSDTTVHNLRRFEGMGFFCEKGGSVDKN